MGRNSWIQPRHVAFAGGELVAVFEEVESGKRNDRPALAAALAACRARRATLLIAKLDRLARNARFLLGVVEGSGEGGVVFCDLPQVPPGPVGKFLVTQMAAVAELEAGLISQRTRVALAAAKARGVVLGNPRLRAGSAEQARAAASAKREQAQARAAYVLPYLEAARRAGATTLRELAAALATRGVPAPAGGGTARAAKLKRLWRFKLRPEPYDLARPARITAPARSSPPRLVSRTGHDDAEAAGDRLQEVAPALTLLAKCDGPGQASVDGASP